jgi:hypothetical protein
MTYRMVFVSLVAAALLGVPAGASQPQDYVGKLISNPFLTSPGGESGLPAPSCTGFSWVESFPVRQLDPTDTITLETAIIPFRSAITHLVVGSLLNLRFRDGLVGGLPYKRSSWNDVKVVIHPATGEYELTVNGVHSGPLASDLPCPPATDCLALQYLAIQADVFEESVAWIDSLSLVRDSAAGQDLLFEDGFNQCYRLRSVYLGGVLSTPPPRLNPAGTR